MKKLLILTEWFYPAYKAGGPITSLLNLAKTISDKVNVTVITSAYDLGDKKILDNIITDVWHKQNGIRIKYFTNPKDAADEIEKRDYDFIYLNSMFSPAFTIKPLLKAKKNNLLGKIILAPRGMLASGALSLKPFKKKIFLVYFRLSGIHKKILFHATSNQEIDDIKNIFGKNTRIKFIPNIPDKPWSSLNKSLKIARELKLISISRIAPEKNILFLLRLFKNINFNVKLDIYGMIRTQEYLIECNKIIGTLPHNVNVNINGDIHPTLLKDKLNGAHFFILPTLGENFGHAIYEALSSGTPVIISDKTPWRDLEFKNAGWDISLADKEKFIEVLNKCYEMDNEEYKKWSNGAFNYAKKYYEENNVTEKYLEMFSGKEK